MNGVQKSERDALRPEAKVRIAPALALCAIILLAGVIIGVGVSAIFPSVPGLLRSEKSFPRTLPAMCDRFMARMDEEVGLSSEQKSQVKPIVESHMRQITKIRNQVRPDMLKQMEQLDSQIRPLLTAKQLSAWQKYYDRIQQWNRPIAETQPATQTAPADQPAD